MPQELLHARCFHHPEREAVARCPACGHFYCRECITEHENRVICAECLAAETGTAAVRPAPWRDRIRRAGTALASLMLLWVLFWALGRLLLAMPSDFHEGTIWHRVRGGIP